MKVKKYQTDEERSILTGMIVNDRVLARIRSHLKNEKKPFRSKWSNTVAGWCMDYSAKYERAPRVAIQTLFQAYADSSQDEDSVQLIEKFLSSLSDDYKGLAKEMNEDHLIDVAAAFFNQVRMERLCQSVEADLLKRDVESAHQRVIGFTPINLATTSIVGVLTDKEVLADALAEDDSEVMIHYPGALGEFFGPHLCRDGFIAFLAPEKRGKSFWLIDVAWRAMQNKRRTLLYSVGDMSQRQMMRRLIVRAARRPLGSERVVRPMSIKLNRDGTAQVRRVAKHFKGPISYGAARAAMKEVKAKTAHTDSLLKLKCTSNSTTRVLDIQSDIDELVRDGWVPDVVVIDYADILAAESGAAGVEFRHQTNETWKALRRLSQDNHCLVVTATQSDAASYDSEVLRRRNFSEDKRKLSHVTGMAGLNQTEEEKEKGIYRLNWILLREGVYYESQCVTVAGCLGLANPALVSIW